MAVLVPSDPWNISMSPMARTARNAPRGTHRGERTEGNAPRGTHRAARTERNARSGTHGAERTARNGISTRPDRRGLERTLVAIVERFAGSEADAAPLSWEQFVFLPRDLPSSFVFLDRGGP